MCLQVNYFVKKKTSTPVLSCEICEIYENTYFEEHMRTTAPGYKTVINPFHIASLFYTP